MKTLLLLFAALPLIAEEPAAPSEPVAPPAAPANEESSAVKPELPARSTAPRDDKGLELLRRNPTPENRQVPPAKPAKPLSAKAEPKLDALVLPIRPATDPSREKGRNTLRPPVTSTDLDLRIRYRKARTFAEQDAAVVAAWEASRTARTDYAKRDALKRYYALIRAKVLAVDSGVASLLEERYTYSARRLEQTRVDPTDPLDEDHRANQ